MSVDNEPLAFLGVWLRKANDFTSARAHMESRKDIKPEQIQAYARELGL